MYRVLKVARSGWSNWRGRLTLLNQRQQFRQQCNTAVSQAFHQAKQRYGASRLTDELRAGADVQCQNGGGQFEASGFKTKAVRKLSPFSYRAHNLLVSGNMLNQDTASAPNQKWV
ncbi:hypothetical protein RI820_002215 [Pluralibacter gergoviae]|nr:hypothetical protein [Pluralibacter gergoviae]ELC3016777.1 hypothetical protein [Pluralibacter gergoviae]ELC3022296.1 hypothetical protein [Pluralibacter gergoviae]